MGYHSGYGPSALADGARWQGKRGVTVRPVSQRIPGSGWFVATLLVFLQIAGGCTLNRYAKDADRTAYSAIKSAQGAAVGKAGAFDVKYKPFGPEKEKKGQIVVGKKVISIGSGKVQALGLDECLEIAFRNSRAFQTEKEELYSTGLAVASDRRSWNWPLLAGTVTAGMSETRVGKADTTESGVAQGAPTVTQRLISGGTLILGATLDFATDFLGSDGITVGSLIDANFTQPLLRGAWRGLAYEDQYRLERDFLFAVFEYERFTQTFATTIINQYYSVLQQRDLLANEAANIERLKDTLTLTRVQAEAGQVSRIQQDQAEQNLISAQVRYETNRQSYNNAVDNFKLTLGLPVEAGVEPDYPAALEELVEAGLKPIGTKETEAIGIALSVRPDVLTERAELRDAERDVDIAADNFLPQLDVEFDFSAGSVAPKAFQKMRFSRGTLVNSVSLQYDIDQTDNRNTYRNALIAMEKAKRDLAEFEDGVRVEVRQSYRTLLRSQRNYDLQVRNVEIAKRRRKLASLQQKEGQASARDVLEAEEALRSAQNGLTNALISYTTTRLTFLASLGMISVNEKGKVNERAKPFRFDRIQRRYKYVGQ